MEFTNFYSADPPQHPQLFCCSLLQTLQSPPPVMSSSSALFFPRSSRGVGAPSNDSGASAGSRRVTAGGLAESEFAFLESKPSLLDERVARGKAAGGNGKRRRHAGEAILRRKLANQAFLVKVGSGGSGKELSGGKSGGGRGRRGQRVLSELVADQFAPSVPYSLNRKSRWAQEGADWLTELAGGWNDGPKLRLSLAEADYSLVGTKSVRALHRLEMADKGSGRNESRWAKSSRGALLADLARSEVEEAEERENEEPSEELHFQLTRPNPVSRLFAGKFFKRKPFRYNKRSGGMELSAGKGGAPMPTNRPPVTESEPEEESEFLAQYRPRRETYSLADFVKDSSPQSAQNQQHSSMVIVRRKNANNKSAGGGAHLQLQDELNSFAIIPELECIPLPDSPADFPANNDSSLSSTHPSAEECPKQHCPNALSQLRQQLLNTKNSGGGFFRQFPLALAISGTAKIDGLATQQPDWHPQWLGTDLLALDLSWTLDKGPETQTLVLVLSPGELLVNSLIQLNEQKVAQALDGAENGLEQKIRSLLDAVRSDFAEWKLSNQHQRNASAHEHLRATFHSARMSLALQPLSIQAILTQQRAELGREEESQRQQFVGAEELLGTGTKLTGENLDEEEDEEFELIDMDELLGGVKRDNSSNSPLVSTPKCADCSSTKSNVPLAMVTGCGHRCCRECLGNAVEKLESGGAINLHCPICPSQLPLDLLPWVLPIPAVNAFILLREAELAIKAGHHLAQCRCCQSILDAGGNDGNLTQFVVEFGQISCNRCALHWCPKCEQEPHWPMDCAQNGEWTRRIRPNEGTQQQQQINGQFAEICTESRARRLDARLGWQLGKHMRRLSDSRTERRFLLARKTALHLLEFGTAWLYLNRQPRPPTWNQLKSLLWAIRERVECLDNELLFSGSLTDAETIKAKLADLEQLGEKGLAKFGAALAKKSGNIQQ